MSPFRLKFSQMILHTETSKLMYNNWSFLFVVLHKPTLLPSLPLKLVSFQIHLRMASDIGRIFEQF